MPARPQLETERLVLRRWRAEDLEPLSRLCADPLVMEHFPAPLSALQSADLLRRLEAGFRRRGFGFWALEISDGEPLIGFVGLSPIDSSLAFGPAVEIGWRLAKEHWGLGLAREAAEAAIRFGFQSLQLTEIVAYTAARNLRSRRLMERLGMVHDPAADFAHPDVDPASLLSAHVLYRLSVERWSWCRSE